MTQTQNPGPATDLSSAVAEEAVNPASVIVVHERTLHEDLATTLRRIRENPATRGSRIMIISKDDEDGTREDPSDPVIAPPPEPVTRSLLRQPESVGWKVSGEAVRRLGARVQRMSEAMDQFLIEGKKIVGELRVAPYQTGRNELKRTIQRTSDLIEWLEVTNRDLLYIAAQAAEGLEQVPTADLLRDAVRVTQARFPAIAFEFPARDADTTVYLSPFHAYMAFLMALWTLAERIGGAGQISIQVRRRSLHLDHEFRGTPASGTLVDEGRSTHVAARLHHLVCERHGGRILPGADGPEGASLVIGFPLRAFTAEVRDP
jgi:hypothetical protein